MSEPVRWGVMSTATINEKVLRGAAMSPDVDVVAVASRDPERAAEFAGRWGIERAHGGYDALLADDGVEAVYIPLPNGMHHEWTMRALAAGKHVLCEKPYTRRPAEVTDAFDTADRAGRVLSEAFMYRYHPQIRELARLVGDGAVGDLKLVVSSFSWPTPLTGDVRTDPGLDGGSLLDVGVYCLSAARLLAGEPRTVSAHQIVGPTGVDTSFVATLEFDRGVLAHLDCGFHLPDRSLLEVVGTTGVITVCDPWHCVTPGVTVSPQGGTPWQVEVYDANSYRLELEEFGRAVHGEENVLLGREDAMGQARAIEALYRAAASGQRQTVPA